MKHCWRCGSEMSSYSGRCSTCGGSTVLTAAFQILSAAAVGLAFLVFTGVVPKAYVAGWIARADWLPALPVATEPPVETGHVTGAAAVPVSGYGGSPNERELARPAAAAGDRRDGRAAESRGSGAGRPAEPCDSPERLQSIGAANPDWSAAEVGLIACGDVRAGFTVEQVEAAFGRPDRVERTDADTGRAYWHYGTRRLLFEAGRLVNIVPAR